MWVEDDVMYMGYYSAGARVVDVSGELRGDLYRQGREIARLWTGDPKGFRPNSPFTWGAQPHKGLIYFNDINSGVWITKLAAPPASAADDDARRAQREQTKDEGRPALVHRRTSVSRHDIDAAGLRRHVGGGDDRAATSGRSPRRCPVRRRRLRPRQTHSGRRRSRRRRARRGASSAGAPAPCPCAMSITDTDCPRRLVASRRRPSCVTARL